MFKKIMAIVLVVALTATISIAGTMAYLQDEDSDVNVMTLGNVQIEQIEQERDAEGNLVDFTQAKPAYPAVGPIEWAAEGVDVNGTKYKVFTDELKNVIDKIVTVKNTGKSDAFVRTLIAVEAPEGDPNDLIHINYNNTGVTMATGEKIQVDGVDYVYFVFTYNAALAPDDISAPSLMQVFLDSKATNEDCAKFGDTWEILVLSQAVQTQGFNSAQAALDTAFGEATAEKATEWFDTIGSAKMVSNCEELQAAINASKDGEKINVMLTGDIELDAQIEIPSGSNIVLNMNGKTMTMENVNIDPMIESRAGSTLVITGNGTFDLEDYTAASILRPRGDVTIESGNFIRNPFTTSDTGWDRQGVGAMFVGVANGQGKLIIEGGYFDGGYYNIIDSTGEVDCEKICLSTLNLSNNQYVRVYGGIFVGMSPAWGDEGFAELCPCNHAKEFQGVFLEGQNWDDTELPVGYNIVETVHADGRPIFTVEYNK